MTIRLYTENDRDRWNAYVLGASAATCYHLTVWKEIIEQSFGHKAYYLISEDNASRIDGILPLVHINSRLFGNYVVSLPYFNYGGVCAENPEVGCMLLEEGAKLAHELRANHMELRQTIPVKDRLPTKDSKVAMKLTLPGSHNDLWKSFPSKLRSQIRRPQKDGMRARIGKLEELDSFYRIFSTNMRDLGTPVYAKTFFRNILASFPASSWLCTVYTAEEKPVASAFLIGFRDAIEIPWASSLRAYNQQSPNMLLYWSALTFACEKGYKVFDFGRSTRDGGTYKFKEQWGAKPVQLYWQYWMRNGGPLPELNPRNPRYQIAIKIWQRLPVSLTKLIGPKIVKNLP